MKGKRAKECSQCCSINYKSFKKFVYDTLKMWLCVDCYDLMNDLKASRKGKQQQEVLNSEKIIDRNYKGDR